MEGKTFDREAATRAVPGGQALAADGWVLAGFGITRDSDPLEESNYAYAMRRLAAAAGIDAGGISWPGEPDPAEPIAVARFGHWAVGWVHEIVVQANRTDLLAVADELLARQQDYAILDEDDYCAREWEANHPADGECYSDDPECCSA